MLRPDHPIVEGIPREFQLPQTEMYDEPFHVPEPDEVDPGGALGVGRVVSQRRDLEARARAGVLLPPRPRDLSDLQAADPAPDPHQRGALARRRNVGRASA